MTHSYQFTRDAGICHGIFNFPLPQRQLGGIGNLAGYPCGGMYACAPFRVLSEFGTADRVLRFFLVICVVALLKASSIRITGIH
jgi:hypothetical protein